MPTTVERIEDYACAFSKITGVYFPAKGERDRLTVAANSFFYCEKLNWAWINEQFWYEGSCLFQNCSGLETILNNQSSFNLTLTKMLEVNSNVKNLVLLQCLRYPGSEKIRIPKLQNLLMPNVVSIWDDYFYGIDFSSLKKLYISECLSAMDDDVFESATNDLVICSESEKAKDFAETKGFSYMDLSEHTHNLQEMVFFEDDTSKVSCQYCEDCAYSEGFTAKNKMTGVEGDIPTPAPAAPTPGTTPTVTSPAMTSAKPTLSPTSSKKPSAAPTSTPKATASRKPSTSSAVKPIPKTGIVNQTAAPSATSAADDSPGQDLPGKSVKPPAWKRIHTKDNRSIILQWKVVPGTKTYKIYRSGKEKGRYTKIGSVSALKFLFRDRKVKAGRTYYYKIQADNGAFSNLKKYAVNGMTAPEVTVRKKGSGRNVYLEFRVKKYKGKYVEIYMKKKNKFVRISLSENNIKKYKGKMKLRCLLKNKTLSFKVRTFDKKKKAKKYSVYSKILMVKV